MASKGADYGWYRATYGDKSTTGTVAAADTATIDNLVAPRNTKWTVFIQRILLAVTTDAAQTLTFQDDAGTPVVIGKSKSAPGLGVFVVADYGPKGIALTEGKNLDVVISGAGLGCKISVEAYQKLTAAGTTAATA